MPNVSIGPRSPDAPPIPATVSLRVVKPIAPRFTPQRITPQARAERDHYQAESCFRKQIEVPGRLSSVAEQGFRKAQVQGSNP